MMRGMYNVKALQRDYRNHSTCVHQNLIEDGSDRLPHLTCAKPSYRGGAHGWLCSEHYQAQTRRRTVLEDTDAATISFLLAQDKRAVRTGKLSSVHFGRAGTVTYHM